MNNPKFKEILFSLSDTKYRDFMLPLIPTVDADAVIGIRTPALRRLAGELWRERRGECLAFMDELPHEYFEEYMLHGFFIEKIADFDECVRSLDAFLPFVDNWAVTDSVSPKLFSQYHAKLLSVIRRWLVSPHTYAVRYAILCLMKHFLDSDFTPELLELALSCGSEDYYVQMMQAWYLATAVAKQRQSALAFLEKGGIPTPVLEKTVRKCCDSHRIDTVTKDYLKTFLYECRQ